MAAPPERRPARRPQKAVSGRAVGVAPRCPLRPRLIEELAHAPRAEDGPPHPAEEGGLEFRQRPPADGRHATGYREQRTETRAPSVRERVPLDGEAQDEDGREPAKELLGRASLPPRSPHPGRTIEGSDRRRLDEQSSECWAGGADAGVRRSESGGRPMD